MIDCSLLKNAAGESTTILREGGSFPRSTEQKLVQQTDKFAALSRRYLALAVG